MGLWEKIVEGDLMPHGHCLLWRGDLLYMHLGGDVLTAASYFTIPAFLIYLVKKRHDLAFNWVFVMFALFIFLCGLTHVMGILNIWHGFYFAEGMMKLSTGIISAITAVAVWKLIPAAIAIPSRIELEEKMEALRQADARLAEANVRLEAKVAERTEQLEMLTRIDDLTGLLNRRETLARLDAEIKRSNRYVQPLTLLVIDLDDFKKINDTFGHSTGDDVLRAFAKTLSIVCRVTDAAGRLGGEEFSVIMPTTDKDAAHALATRLLGQVIANPLVIDGETHTVTCSIGVAERLNDESAASLLKRADEAMYRSKHAGKNRVSVDSP